MVKRKVCLVALSIKIILLELLIRFIISGKYFLKFSGNTFSLSIYEKECSDSSTFLEISNIIQT